MNDRGQLADEQDPSGELSTLYTYDPLRGDYGGTSVLSADATTFTITPTDALPLNPALVLIVEPGLKDVAYGVPTVARRKIVFSYQLDLKCNAPSNVHAGARELLHLDRRAEARRHAGEALRDDRRRCRPASSARSSPSATRNTDPNRCTPPCASTDACRTLPGPPACVAPSTAADTTDEYPDFVINTTPSGVLVRRERLRRRSTRRHGALRERARSTSSSRARASRCATRSSPRRSPSTRRRAPRRRRAHRRRRAPRHLRERRGRRHARRARHAVVAKRLHHALIDSSAAQRNTANRHARPRRRRNELRAERSTDVAMHEPS